MSFGQKEASGNVSHQGHQVGPFRVTDQAFGGLGLVIHQVTDRGFGLFRFQVVVPGHAQGIPGGAVHGLQLGGPVQGLGGGGVLPQMGVDHAQAVPGPIVLGVEFGGAAQGFQPALAVAGLVPGIAQVEPGVGVIRGQGQRLVEPFGGGGPAFLLGMDPGHAAGRPGIPGVGAKAFNVGFQSLVRLTQPLEQDGAQREAKMVEIHGGDPLEKPRIFPACRPVGKLKSRIFMHLPNRTAMPFDLLVVSVLRVLVEVAGFALLGQGVLALLAGKQRFDNLFYKILQTITQPVVKGVRLITPRFILDAHVPMVTFFLLFWLWIALAFAKRHFCALHGLAC